MDRWRALRRFQVNPSDSDSEPNTPTAVSSPSPPPPFSSSTEEHQGTMDPPSSSPRRARPPHLFPFKESLLPKPPSLHPDSKRDYLNVASRHPHFVKILSKNGELKVLFADKVLKVGASGKMKQRVLLITDFSIYLLDPITDTLKRRVATAEIKKLCLSNYADHFLAIIVQHDYDCLIASTRKMEIISAVLEAIKNSSEDEIDVSHSNSFIYRASSQIIKEVVFDEVEEGIKTRILKM